MHPMESQLSEEVSHYLLLARINYFTLFVLYVIAVAASVLATICAATGWLPRAGLAVTTAVPGIVLLVNNTFKFNARAQWHFEKRRRLASLLRLRQSGANATTPAEVAEKWNRIDEEMDKAWPGWGTLPTIPHRPSNGQ
jgi:hypothetical protein